MQYEHKLFSESTALHAEHQFVTGFKTREKNYFTHHVLHRLSGGRDNRLWHCM